MFLALTMFNGISTINPVAANRGVPPGATISKPGQCPLPFHSHVTRDRSNHDVPSGTRQNKRTIHPVCATDKCDSFARSTTFEPGSAVPHPPIQEKDGALRRGCLLTLRCQGRHGVSLPIPRVRPRLSPSCYRRFARCPRRMSTVNSRRQRGHHRQGCADPTSRARKWPNQCLSRTCR